MKVTVPTESFFNFFSPPKPPHAEDDDEDVASDIEERLELDYQLGEDIKEKLIPRAIDWFTGEALQFEELDEEEEDPDEFEEDDEDDEDDDDDDDRRSGDVEEESDEEVFISFKPAFPISNIHTVANHGIQDDGSRPKKEAAECKQS